MYLLENYREQARRAHYWTSFHPEERAEQMVREQSEELSNDLEKIAALGGDVADYQQRYERLFANWLRSKSNCASTMITGGSNFNVRRNEKANRSERNRYDEFAAFRAGYVNRLQKAINRAKRAASDPLAEMREQLAQAEDWHEKMKAANPILKNKKLSDAEKIGKLLALGFSEQAATEALQPYAHWLKGPQFPTFALTNSLANIKRMRDRVKVLESKASAVTQEAVWNGVRVVYNREEDRLQLFFPEKPAQDTINDLKRTFRWSPTNGCWQRQLTRNAVEEAKDILRKLAPQEA